jgi:site-specific DNA-cytosine methylase
LTEKQPKAFLFENVVGLVLMEGGARASSNGVEDWRAGKVFEHILSAFSRCGYQVDWRVIDAALWLPQVSRLFQTK